MLRLLIRLLGFTVLLALLGVNFAQTSAAGPGSNPTRKTSQLIRDLLGPSYDARVKASAALLQSRDPHAVKPLIRALHDSRPEVRCDAVVILGKIGDRKAVPALAATLRDPDFWVRHNVTEALSSIGDRHAVPALIKALEDQARAAKAANLDIELQQHLTPQQMSQQWSNLAQDPNIQFAREVLQALGTLGDPRAVPPLIDIFSDLDQSGWIRSAAAQALGKIRDPRAIPALAAELQRQGTRNDHHFSNSQSRAAADALAAFGSAGIDPLIAALNEPHSDSEVARALGAINDPRAWQWLLEYNGLRNAWIRDIGIEAITDPRAVDALIGLLSNKDDFSGQLARAAAQALGNIGDRRAVEPLIAALPTEKDKNARAQIATALGKLKDPRAFDALAESARNDPDAAVRTQAIVALALLNDPRVTPYLGRRVAADDIGAALPQIERAGPVSTDLLITVLRSTSATTRLYVVTELTKRKDPRAVEALLPLLNDSDFRVQRQTIDGLGAIGDARAVPALIAMLHAPGPLLPVSAAQALGQIRDPSAVPALAAAMADPSPGLEGAAIFALGQIGGPSVLPPLIAALQSSDTSVRMQVAVALGTTAVPKNVVEFADLSAVAALIASLHTGDAQLSQASADALAQFGQSAADALMAALRDADPKVQARAAIILGRIRDRGAVDPLLAALHDPTSKVRSAAATALGSIGDPRVSAPLLDAMRDPEFEVRVASAKALVALRAPDAVPSLLAELSSSDV